VALGVLSLEIAFYKLKINKIKEILIIKGLKVINLDNLNSRVNIKDSYR
jgi:hypothetical protein